MVFFALSSISIDFPAYFHCISCGFPLYFYWFSLYCLCTCVDLAEACQNFCTRLAREGLPVLFGSGGLAWGVCARAGRIAVNLLGFFKMFIRVLMNYAGFEDGDWEPCELIAPWRG